MNDNPDSKAPERISGCPYCGHDPLLTCTVSGWKYECINVPCQVNPATILHANAKDAALAWDSRPTITPQQAAKVLLEDDVNISTMAKAMHDGPLMADEYEFRVDTKAGGWCIAMIRAALKALAEHEE